MRKSPEYALASIVLVEDVGSGRVEGVADTSDVLTLRGEAAATLPLVSSGVPRHDSSEALSQLVPRALLTPPQTSVAEAELTVA